MVAFPLLMSTSCIQLSFDLPYDNPKNSHRSLFSSHYPWRAPHPQPSLLPTLCGWWTTALNHQTIKVYSFKCLERVKAHRALFLHVSGPEDAPRQTRLSMWFEELKNKEAFNTPFYKQVGTKTLVGTVDVSKYARFYALCKGVTPPSVPQNYPPKRPNCRSWNNNVLYQSNVQKLINFNERFSVPTVEVRLQI